MGKDDYSHFYGQGASPGTGDKCPLWSENDKLHKHEVAKAVEEVKKTMDFKKLKHDPSKGIANVPANFNPRQLAVPREEDLSGDDDDDEYDDDDMYDIDDEDGYHALRELVELAEM